jgi:HlyD family secretion protein
MSAEPADARTPDARNADHGSAARRAMRLGYAAIALFAGSVGVWAVTSTISGAVIAPAQFVADTNLKKVQHQTGGIVAELRVREGDHVKEGDLLLRLDETLLRANLGIVSRQIDEFLARSARLEAERDQSAGLIFPAALESRAAEPGIAALMAHERRLFESRAQARAGVRAQLTKRIGQLRSEIEGLLQQREAKIREASMIQRELVGVRELFRQNLVQITRLSQLEREGASLEGQRGQLTAGMAQAEGRIAETELQILQLVEDLRAESMKELRDIQARLAELSERRVAAEDQLRRSELRAPAAGTVHQLAVHTVGGVMSPGEPAMLIVPSGDMLHLEARVAPPDYDQLRIGQNVTVRLHAFNQRTTPELSGSVSRLAADVTREPQTGLTYYVIRVALPQPELARIAPLTIVAGMQADAYIETYARTPFDYLAKPVKDQFAKAFRER